MRTKRGGYLKVALPAFVHMGNQFSEIARVQRKLRRNRSSEVEEAHKQLTSIRYKRVIGMAGLDIQ